MKQKDLLTYKEKIHSLDEIDTIFRDLDLKKYYAGEKSGPLTGYATIDKPWVQYLTEDEIHEVIPKMSLFSYVLENNKDHLEDYCLEYYGNKITYLDFFANIERAREAFATMGVKQGDIVTFYTLTTPEVIYAFYALNQMGAVCNFIDIRYQKKLLEKELNEVHSKYMVTLDVMYKTVEEVLGTTPLEKCICINPKRSVPTILRKLASIKEKELQIPETHVFTSWDSFIQKRVKKVYSLDSEYVPNSPCVIVHTGGTTGVPKGVVLTNENLNAASLETLDVFTHRGYKFLNIMPPFIAYGLVLGLHVPLSLGATVSIVPKFEPEKLDEYLLKKKPNGVTGVPSYWEAVMASSKMKGKDLSFLQDVLLGGDKVATSFEEKLNIYLKDHGVERRVAKGYSMTEVSSMTTFSLPNANKVGSVGIPLNKVNVGIFEPGTDQELGYSQVGEIYIATPTMMKEYYHHPEETKQVKINIAGKEWIRTGDLGYMNSDGLLYVVDRMKRMFPRSGWKVYPSQIENLFMQHPAVQGCAVIGVDDPKDVHAPKAILVLKNSFDSNLVISELEEMFHKSTLPHYFEPVSYEVRESLPLTPIGKVDFVTLEKQEKEKKLLLEKTS